MSTRSQRFGSVEVVTRMVSTENEVEGLGVAE